MELNKQIKALAEIDGYIYTTTDDSGVLWGNYKCQKTCDNLHHLDIVPSYNTFDDMHRLINGMDDDTKKSYWRNLSAIVGGIARPTLYSTDEIVIMIGASVEQMREAILKAYGKWEESDEEN